MKIYFILFLIALNIGCKPKVAPVVKTASDDLFLKDDRVIGKVSHQFHSKSCSTVIIIKNNNEELMLEPINQLEKEIDVDGVSIRFHYQLSRKSQKQECLNGSPAIISDIEAI